MRELKSAGAIWGKAALFASTGCLAATLLLMERPSWRVGFLLVVAAWSFCRLYYFAFYVVERYADPSYRFSGLWSFVRYALGKRSTRMESGRFDVNAIARSFPETAETMLLDRYLSDEPEISARVFRVYTTTPAHYHEHCDEHLFVLSGRGTMWIGEPSNVVPFEPGILLKFKRNTVHAMPEMIEGPVIFLAMDTPRRQPGDVVFVDSNEGTAKGFVQGY